MLLAGLLLGYALGSVPFGLVLSRLAGAGDIRAIGSGNIGATNVLRTGRKGLAAATLLLDAAKGAVAVLVMARLAGPLSGPALAAAAGAMLGHCFPLWLRFKGGKGVATLLGVSLALAWPVGIGAALVWLAILRASRISSLAGMGAALSAPLFASVLGPVRLALLLLALALLVVWLHRANVARLRAGTEPRVGRGKDAPR
ncbi:MAG: glycerol-3-phosphate 1-O-acyltransferase PlsY [Sphingomonadales bacterium]|nr:glycerol-3-phosphate 1-O-acyltransferase PlsY [Sphingomonadales bacterium]